LLTQALASEHVMQRRYRFALALGIVAVLLLCVRLALPWVVKRYVNDQLQALEAYDGSVADIDMQLWRGAYRIDGIRIVKTGAKQPTPFFSSDYIECSIEWRSLFKGSLVAEGVFGRPVLNLVQAANEQQSQLGKEVNWADQFEELFPFRFNTVEIRDGTVTFRAPGINTRDALTARAVNGQLSNLTNVADRNRETFADFRVTGKVLGEADVKIAGTVDPLAQQPTFDVNLSLDRVQIKKVNPWLRHYIKADAQSGDFALYMELAAAEGRFKGYAKPLMQNVEILGADDANKPALRKIWEGIVEFASKVFENKAKDQVAARVPFSGSLEDPKASILATIASVLRNAFVGAFAHSLEGSISLRDVKHSLENLDTTDDDRRQRKERPVKSASRPAATSKG
jgi:hypothetical protein